MRYIIAILLLACLPFVSEALEYSPQYNKEKEGTHEFVGYALIADMITPIYIYWGSEDYGNRICASQGDTHLYLQTIPKLLDTNKVKKLYKSLED